ncbi:ribonuclease 3 [Physcia stellaris]|nr:ribonuclease 3 [Physcia stellaris]
MPGRITTFVKRLNDGVDEWHERLEDAEAGRRNKYGLKTHKWYEEEDRKREERKKQQKERHRRHRHHRRGSKERGEHGERGGPGEEDLVMSGANEDAAQDHEREQPRDGEEHVVAAEERPRRRRRHRSRHREDNDNASIHQSRSRNRERDNRSEHRRRGRGDVEILERTNVPYGREPPLQGDGAPQPYGPPQAYGPPQMLAPPGANGPPAEDREKNARNRRTRPQDQPPRHPNMRSYDGGGFTSLAKAVAINLVEEYQRRKNEAKKSNGGRKDEEKRRERHERHKERRRRPRSRGHSPVRPRAPRGEGAEGHDQSGENPPRGRAHSEERLQDINGAPYGQAAHLAGSRGPSSHRDVSPLSSVQGNRDYSTAHRDVSPLSTVHEDGHHSAADPMGSTISSMPPSTIGEPQSRAQGNTSRISDIDPSATGTSNRRASVAGSTHARPESTTRRRGRQRQRPVEATDSESGYSGHEGEASTRASIRSPRSTPPSSATSNSGARGGNSGRGGGQERGTHPRGGAGNDDDVGGEYYNLHESYDDEYDRPGRFFDARPLRNNYQPFPQSGCRFGHSSFQRASHANQGSYHQGFCQYGPVLVQIPGTNTWVTMAQYQAYLQHRQQSTTTAPRKQQGCTDPHRPGSSGRDDHPSKRRGRDAKANEERGRHGGRRNYDSPDLSDTDSSDHSDTDSSTSSDDNSRSRKPRSSHDAKYKPKSHAESNTKYRSSDTKYPSRRDAPKPSDRRSPRPYARNENRAPKSRKRHSDGRSPRPYARNQNRASKSRDTDSFSETESERENDRFSARDDGYDSSEDSNTDRRSKPKPKPKAKSEPTRKSKAKPQPPSYSDSSDSEWDDPSTPPIPEKPTDFYAVIGLTKTASAAEIKTALRKTWLAVHPDKIDSSAMTEAEKQSCRERAAGVGQAMEVFKDEGRKGEYDKSVERWERLYAGEVGRWGRRGMGE